jgi:large subunit ribosomal protein L4
MSEITVFDKAGGTSRVLSFPDLIQGKVKGRQAVHEVVVAHLAAVRGGNASTLSKGQVAGSNKKPWKQKGTGRARAGYRQSPVWRGGGIAFGPKPRDYSVKLNKKVRVLALRRAFSERVQASQVRVVESISLQDSKTKTFLAFLKAHQLSAPLLVVVDEAGSELQLSCRNVPKVELVRASDLTAYELVRYPSVLMNVAAVEQIQKRLEQGAK